MVVTVILLVLLIGIYSTDAVELKVQGLVPAAYTPFDHEGNLNVTVVPEYADYLQGNRIDGVLLGGTSGEGPALSLSERKELLDAWIEAGKPRGLKIVMQVGGLPLPEVLEMAKYSEKAGADAILTLPEMYYKPASESAIVHYVKRVSDAAPSLPILYYHHPSMSGVNIKLAKFFKEATSSIPNFKGIKCNFLCGLELSASGELADDQEMFMTSHLTTASNLMMGYNSSMSAVISIFPKLFLAIEEAISSSNVGKARELQQELNRRVAVITSQGDYVPFSKAAMQMVSGIRVGDSREPLTRPSDEQKRLLRERLRDIDVKLYGI